jgi:hypothetical protein
MENGNGLTKADLAAALTDLRTGLKKEIVDELTEKMQTMNAELTERMQTMNDDLTDKMRQIETNLHTDFHRYGKGQQLRLHTIESRDAIITERLAIIEERLLHLESRRPPTV